MKSKLNFINLIILLLCGIYFFIPSQTTAKVKEEVPYPSKCEVSLTCKNGTKISCIGEGYDAECFHLPHSREIRCVDVNKTENLECF